MNDDKIPTAIAEAEMDILGFKIKVHVLDNGQRVIDQSDMIRFLGGMATEFTDLEICEACCKPLMTGDLVHRCADGPILCEECAPTWADVLTQYSEPDSDFGAFVDKTPEEFAEDRAAAKAHVDAGDGDKKHVWPL